MFPRLHSKDRKEKSFRVGRLSGRTGPPEEGRLSNPFPRSPRFKSGDSVVVSGLGMHRDRLGVVVEIIDPGSGMVYRYRVRFADGAIVNFFGFELTLADSSRDTLSA